MRIIVLCLSPSRGGLELYALDELIKLKSLGHDCHAVVAADGYLAESLKKDSIPYSVIKTGLNRLPLISASRLKNIARDFNADILHFHWGKDLYLAALAKSMLGNNITLVHSRHMNYTRNKNDFFHRWFYNKIDLLLVGTKVLQNLAIRYLPIDESRIKLLYLGAAKPGKKMANCQQFFNSSFEKRKLNLAVFGRIEEGKGQHIVIDAVKKLLSESYDISLTMIGYTMDNDYKKALEDTVTNNKLAGHIQFKGFVENAASTMCCFDVVVLSTHCETFGLVLVEAMRAGVAVIGTNDGGVPEIIEDRLSGLLAEPRDVESMSAAIDCYYKDEEFRNNLASAGKNRADRLFATENHYPLLEELLLASIH